MMLTRRARLPNKENTILLLLFSNYSSSPTSSPLPSNLLAPLTPYFNHMKLKSYSAAKHELRSFAALDDLSSPFPSIASSIHTSSTLSGVSPSTVFDMLFRVYSDANLLSRALETFELLLSKFGRVDGRSCGVYLHALRRLGRMDSALEFFNRMLDIDCIDVSEHSMAIVVDGLCDNGEIEAARKVFEEMRQRGLRPNILSYNSLVEAYIKRLDFDSVDEVLKLIDADDVRRNAATYTVLINGFSGSGDIDKAEKAFEEAKNMEGLVGDVYLYTSIINANCRVGNIKRALLLFDECVAKGIGPNDRTYGVLINGLCKAGQVIAAEMLIDEMQQKGIDYNQVIFNTMIDGYCKKGMIDKALHLKSVMEKKGMQLDVYTYNTIACGLCKLNRLKEAKRILYEMVDSGVDANTVSLTTLIDVLCKEGDYVEARRLFREMGNKGSTPNVITYNVLIDGYSKKGSIREAERLKKEMEKKGIVPDVYTYTSLIHGHCVGGKVRIAKKLFDEMKKRGVTANVVTYTALISGLSKEGQSEEAFRLYEQMIKAGLKPDDSVYSSLVSSFHKTTNSKHEAT
ncbi:putative tetratricopeptide-like helical domain superfamily [Dioscorea sansibarensis]